MFTKLILIFTAMAMVATALVVSPNMTSRCTRSMHKRTPLPHDSDVNTPNTLRKNLETGESENTYTAQQIEQFQAGHNDALWLCKTVIEEATNKPDRFDKIFRQYFPFSDRQLVIGKYLATTLSGTSQLTEYMQMCSKPFSTPMVKAKVAQSSETSTSWTTTHPFTKTKTLCVTVARSL